jgi:hypothetical protein
MDKPQLPNSLESTIPLVDEFITSDDRILLVKGMIGTGKDHLYQTIDKEATRNGRNCSVLAPNLRMANRYPIEAKSVYGHIYSKNPQVQNDQIVYDLSKNHDSSDHIYVLGDSNLVSDSPFETEVLRFGSGKLLSDFITFVDLSESQRKIIFIGDPYQMMRGKVEESALSPERLHAITKHQAKTLDLVLSPNEAKNDLVKKNCLEIAKGLRQSRFNQLSIELDNSRCLQLPSRDPQNLDWIHKYFADSPNRAKYIAFTHNEVNWFNNLVRKEVFDRKNTLAVGDVIHIHNGFFAKNEHEIDKTEFVPNDSFAKVLAIEDNIKPIVQPLQGRPQPIVVPLLKIRAQLYEKEEKVEFFCLKDYLYSGKPELDSDTLLALYVDAQNRFRSNRENAEIEPASPEIESNQQNTVIEKAKLKELQAKFLQSDPYFNAARVRFGYALTLHRAQGRKFDTVIAGLQTETGSGKTNETYFRMIYTLFVISGDRLVFDNIPHITPFDKAVWDQSQAQLSTSLGSSNLVDYDPDSEECSVESPHPIEEAPLRNLYSYVVNAIESLGSEVTTLEHHSYQEVYGFKNQWGDTCTLRLFYNKRFLVTRIETVTSDPDKYGMKVESALKKKSFRFEGDSQKHLFHLLEEKLGRSNMKITGIDHSQYQEIYYISSDAGNVKLRVHYDKKGGVTKFSPLGFTTSQALDELKTALGA